MSKFKLIPKPKSAKEIGMPKNAPSAAKKADEALDAKKGLKEGSKADLKADTATMKKFPAKKGKK